MRLTKLQHHLISCFYSDDMDLSAMPVKDQVRHVKSVFESEKPAPNKPELQNLTEWLSGLCGTVNLEYMHYDIDAIGYQLGYISERSRETTKQNFRNNWFKLCASHLADLFRKCK